MSDYDQPFDRTESQAEKWDKEVLAEKYGSDDVLPFWIADMDFPASPAILERLAQRTRQATFGYERRPESLVGAVQHWNATRHNWTIDASAVRFTSGTMHSITQMLETFTNTGDGVIIQPPVYFQFHKAVQLSGRNVVLNPLQLVGGRYELDFDDLERKAATASTKALLLCNPHNPVGRVWRREELQRVADICLQHDVIVLADEVHADFVFSDHSYTPFLSLSDEVAQHSVSFLSPAKPFNIPSIATGFTVIPNSELQDSFDRLSEASLLDHVGAFGCVATQAAYTESAQWLDATIKYVQQNVDFLCEAVEQRISGVDVVRPEGTFLAWLDFRKLQLSTDQLEAFLAKEAKIALKPGQSFGAAGEGFCRMSIGCSRDLLKQAISRLEQALATKL